MNIWAQGSNYWWNSDDTDVDGNGGTSLDDDVTCDNDCDDDEDDSDDDGDGDGDDDGDDDYDDEDLGSTDAGPIKLGGRQAVFKMFKIHITFYTAQHIYIYHGLNLIFYMFTELHTTSVASHQSLVTSH